MGEGLDLGDRGVDWVDGEASSSTIIGRGLDSGDWGRVLGDLVPSGEGDDGAVEYSCDEPVGLVFSHFATFSALDGLAGSERASPLLSPCRTFTVGGVREVRLNIGEAGRGTSWGSTIDLILPIISSLII